MSDPIDPATIDPIHPADLLARLRELDAAATPSPWAADELYCSDGPWTSKADAALIAAMRNALTALLDQLAAQAAEIERLNKGFHESCIAREEAANARAKKAEARVAELTALIRSIYAQDVEDDQQSPVEDLLRHLAGEYGKARCRVRELERERAELEELLRKHAALACGACAGTGTYLGDEDRDGPCDVCGGTGSVLPEDVAAVLAGREGGR